MLNAKSYTIAGVMPADFRALPGSLVSAHAEAIARVADPSTRYEMEAKASKLPPPILKMSEIDFLRVDYRTNMQDIAVMAERMHAAGWTKRNLAGEVHKNGSRASRE